MEAYSEQVKVWPGEGRHILAQYDDDSIIVYQAYRPSIGQFAADNGMASDRSRSGCSFERSL